MWKHSRDWRVHEKRMKLIFQNQCQLVRFGTDKQIRQNRDKATPRTTLSFRRRFLTSRSLPISAVCPPYRENIFCSIPRLFSSVFAKFGRGLIVSFVERFGKTIGIWIFADRPVIHKGDVVVCKHIDRGTIQHIANGANVLILNPSGIKKTPLSYHKLMAGRTVGNTATVIADHPALADFPHDGWCDMQFYRMFENGYCAVFDQTAPLQFDPIIEVVNSYKTVIRQSVLFAFQVGRGKAVVCTLNMDGDNPEKRAFLSSILSYMNSNQFVPKQTITVAQAEQFLLGNDFVDLDYDPETGFDGNAK